jgi:hypothetical protein
MITQFQGIRALLGSVCTLTLFALAAAGQDCTKHATSFNHGIVHLTVKKTQKETGVVIEGKGTGFVVSPQGFVITADHLVSRDATTDDVVIVGSIGSMYSASSPLKIVEENGLSDVAMLKFLDSSRSYEPIRLGCPWKLQAGALLCSLGYSSKPMQDYHATTGTLSSLSGEDKPNKVNDLWTTQMPSNEGESGSPVLLISDGGVIAVKYGGVPTAQNVNYIIPIYHAQSMLLTYTGSPLPQCEIAAEQLKSEAAMYQYSTTAFFKGKLLKSSGDQQVIPIGGWHEFEVTVVDPSGKPVQGAKVAWQTPVGGSLTYVAETDRSGVARSTNLYTFPTKGTYFQTARVVDPKTPVGFVDATIIAPRATSTPAVFEFKQQ